MRSDGGTAISLLQSDTDPQARTEFAAGFYVPHAIVSGVVKASRFNELGPSGNRVTDSLTSYAMTFDVFKKNIPYTALFSIGYDLRSKYYAATATTSATTDSLGAVMLGVDASAQVTEDIKGHRRYLNGRLRLRPRRPLGQGPCELGLHVRRKARHGGPA